MERCASRLAAVARIYPTNNSAGFLAGRSGRESRPREFNVFVLHTVRVDDQHGVVRGA